MSNNRAIAEAIVSDLFTNGNNQRARRVVLTGDTPETRDLGGWTAAGAADRVERLLNRFNSPLVTVNEATAIAGVSRRTIYNWIASKRVRVSRAPGGSLRIDADSLRPRAQGIDSAIPRKEPRTP